MGSFITQMLSTLLQSVLTKNTLSVSQLAINVFELLTGLLNFTEKLLIVSLVLLVIVTLLGVQVIKLSFVGEVNLLDLLFVGGNFVLHVSLFTEEAVQVLLLLLVLVANVHVQRIDVFWFGVGAVLVERQVVVSELTFALTHVLDQRLVFALEVHVGRVVTRYVLHLLFHLGDLTCNFNVLVLEQVSIVVAIVNLATGARLRRVHSHHTVVSHWAIHRVHLSVVAHSGQIDLLLCGCHSSSSALAPTVRGSHSVRIVRHLMYFQI